MDSNAICVLVGLVFGIVIGAMCMFLLISQRIVNMKRELRRQSNLDEKFKESFKLMASEILEEKKQSLKNNKPWQPFLLTVPTS